MNRVSLLITTLLLLAGGMSCCTTATAPPEDVFSSGDQTPRDTLENFRKSLRKNRWRYVHVLLSERARNCYSQDKLKTFLTRTKPGALEKLRLLRWNVTEIRPGPGENSAVMTLTHPKRPGFTQTYRLRREENYWRLDWSMADVLNVPRSVENCN